MIALDTNVLVRLAVEDDPEQVEKSRRLLDRCAAADEPCLVTIPVLCEMQWVLKRVYKASREDLGVAAETLLTDHTFKVEEPDSVRQALDRFRDGKADLADYLIGVMGRSLGARTTFTFDKALRDEEEFTWLD